MPDIALRSQVVESPGLSVGIDAADHDVWLREQFPAAPDFSVYPTEFPVSPPVASGSGIARTLTGDPGALTLTGAAANFTVGRMLAAAPGALTFTGAAAMLDYVPGTAPAVPDTHDGAGWIKRPERDLRPLERDELRAMLEAAFADAPADPVVVEARREHRLEATDAAEPRVDWSRMLADLTACAAVLTRYTERIDSGRTRIQQGEAAREDLPYSSDSIDQMIASVRAEIAAKKARKRREALLLLLS